MRVVDRLGKGHDHLPKLWKTAIEKQHGTSDPAAPQSDPTSNQTQPPQSHRLDVTPSSQAGFESQDSHSTISTSEDEPTELPGKWQWKLAFFPGNFPAAILRLIFSLIISAREFNLLDVW